jgi:hypothetical protein
MTAPARAGTVLDWRAPYRSISWTTDGELQGETCRPERRSIATVTVGG